MKVIFLDIDGVLNSLDTMLGAGGSNLFREEHLNPISIGILKRLCNNTDAKIVISSTWRMGRDKEDFIDIFSEYGWEDFPYLDKTPIGYEINPIGERTRGHEIQHWLDNNGNPEYIILDDDSDMLKSQLPRFVHVSNVHGFNSKHYCKALRLFGVPDEQLEMQVNWIK